METLVDIILVLGFQNLCSNHIGRNEVCLTRRNSF